MGAFLQFETLSISERKGFVNPSEQRFFIILTELSRGKIL